MRKSITNSIAVLLVLSPLLASAPGAFAAAPPLLSGNYVYTSNKFCQITVIAKYGTSPNVKNTPFVASLITSGGSNTVGLGAGSIKFTPGNTGSGSATINGFGANGSAILLSSTGSGIGGGGIDGAPLATEAESGTTTYTQTATTVSIKEDGGTSTFHIYYGKVLTGIVQNVVFAGVDAKGCVEQYTLTHS
jgi:hypothetical protein